MALPDDLWRECAAWLTRCKIIPADHRFYSIQTFCSLWMSQAEKKIIFPFYPKKNLQSQLEQFRDQNIGADTARWSALMQPHPLPRSIDGSD